MRNLLPIIAAFILMIGQAMAWEATIVGTGEALEPVREVLDSKESLVILYEAPSRSKEVPHVDGRDASRLRAQDAALSE